MGAGAEGAQTGTLVLRDPLDWEAEVTEEKTTFSSYMAELSNRALHPVIVRLDDL